MEPSTIQKLRADTPGTEHCIHLNNAGASLPPQVVTQGMLEYLAMEAQLGGYEVADARAEELAGFYTSVARLINAKAHNIAFAGSATDAYARALSAIPLQSGDVILTTANDYVSNQIAFLALEKHRGIRVVRARDTVAGGVDIDDFEKLLKKWRPKLAAVTHVPTNSGLVQPVAAIGQICRAENTWYLVDACQSAGQLGLDVEAVGCDFLSATMRKFMRGPRGGGFLFASDRVLEAGLEMAIPDMRSADWTGPDTYATGPSARRFEYWEMAPAIVLGSKLAAEYALQIGLDQIETRVKHLADFARDQLRQVPGMQLLDDGVQLCGIVTAYNPDWQQETLLEKLRARHINCRLTSRKVAQIDFARKGVDWALRISPHYYNTEAEIQQAVEVLR
ncbi:MAG: aminotransferase class V-fold PLP-dependent enzyme [Saprospiraceae bacterium]